MFGYDAALGEIEIDGKILLIQSASRKAVQMSELFSHSELLRS